mgnify:CR=1 FL=1
MSKKLKYCSQCGSKLEVSHESSTSRPIPIYDCIVCTERYYNNPTVGVAVIYIKDNKILLGKRNSKYEYGKWCIPCGHLDALEPVIEGAKREFYEETSLQANSLELYYARTNPNNTVGIYYLATNVSSEPKANDDLSEIGFYDFDNLPDLAFKSDIQVIKKLQKQFKTQSL